MRIGLVTRPREILPQVLTMILPSSHCWIEELLLSIHPERLLEAIHYPIIISFEKVLQLYVSHKWITRVLIIFFLLVRNINRINIMQRDHILLVVKLNKLNANAPPPATWHSCCILGIESHSPL